MGDDFRLGAKGLKLDAPAVGDIVTMKGGGQIWKVIAANGATVVLLGLTEPLVGFKYAVPISLNEWYEASELLAALEGESE